MKRINKLGAVAMLLCMGLISLCSAPVAALSGSDFTVDASTYPVDNTVQVGHPVAAQISGAAAIEQVFVSASSTDTAQTVSLYENCTSSTAITLVWRGYIAAGASVAVPAIHLEYPLFNTPLYVEDSCFRKSSTASSVQVNVHYR